MAQRQLPDRNDVLFVAHHGDSLGGRIEPSLTQVQSSTVPITPASASAEPQQSKSKLEDATPKKPKRKRRSPKVPWKKPKDMPKRPLSAYNLYFAFERNRLLQTLKNGQSDEVVADLPKSSSTPDPADQSRKPRSHKRSSGVGFANLTRTIAAKWKALDPQDRTKFEAQAAVEKEKYQKAMLIWRQKKAGKVASTPAPKQQAPVSSPRRLSMPSALTAEPFPPMILSESPHLRRYSEPFPNIHISLGNVLSTDTELQQQQEEKDWADHAHSLGSAPSFFEEDVLEYPRNVFEPPTRSYSDSKIHEFSRQSHFHEITSCEDLARESLGAEEQAKSVAAASLRALSSSLDNESFQFLSTLKDA